MDTTVCAQIILVREKKDREGARERQRERGCLDEDEVSKVGEWRGRWGIELEHRKEGEKDKERRKK